MKKIIICFLLLSLIPIRILKSDEKEEEIKILKKQVQELLEKIEKLEKEQKKVSEKVEPKFKIKGRVAAGYYNSEDDGNFPKGSFEIPEAKIQFLFQPDDINTVIMRMDLNNAKFNTIDYLYLETKLDKLFNIDLPVYSRLGRFKIDFGEETFSNNPVESVLPSNSASNVSGNDEGLLLKANLSKNFSVSLSILNGNEGVGSDNNGPKALSTKFSYEFSNFYISGSFYNSFSLKDKNSEIKIAGLNSPPIGTSDWKRSFFEIDFRYDYKKGKILNPPSYSDSKGIIRSAYGIFKDDIKNGNDRDGWYGFVEGTLNLTDKLYFAARYSIVELDDGIIAKLNGIDSNKYERLSIGFGYRITKQTIFKFSYDFNREKPEDKDNDLFSILVSTIF